MVVNTLCLGDSVQPNNGVGVVQMFDVGLGWLGAAQPCGCDCQIVVWQHVSEPL